MAWTAETIDRIYELYGQHIARLHGDVAFVNRQLGSLQPERTTLQKMSRVDFETMLLTPCRNGDIRNQWLRRIVRGHEREFPELRVDVRQAVNIAQFAENSRPAYRRTGT
jgi:hypothetical protein